MSFSSMGRFILGAAAVSVLATVSATSLRAAPVSVYFDGAFVDTTREGPNLTGDLTTLGHTVTTFTGTSAAAFTAGIGTNSILVFPEMENGDLASSLDAAARNTLTNFVSGGGTIIQANAFSTNATLVNTLLGTSVTQVGNIGGTALIGANAAGTAFAGGPASLPGSNAVEGIALASLPASACIYDDGTDCSVYLLQFGAGQFIYLGFDWFEEPTDPAWLEVLDRAIEQGGDGNVVPVPEPAALALFGAGLVALALSRRRRAA